MEICRNCFLETEIFLASERAYQELSKALGDLLKTDGISDTKRADAVLRQIEIDYKQECIRKQHGEYVEVGCYGRQKEE